MSLPGFRCAFPGADNSWRCYRYHTFVASDSNLSFLLPMILTVFLPLDLLLLLLLLDVVFCRLRPYDKVPMLAGYMDKFEEELHLHLPKLAVHFEVART